MGVIMIGKQSVKFDKGIYIEATATVVSEKEKEGPLGKLFDVVVEDPMAGQGKGRKQASRDCSRQTFYEVFIQKRRCAIYICR